MGGRMFLRTEMTRTAQALALRKAARMLAATATDEAALRAEAGRWTGEILGGLGVDLDRLDEEHITALQRLAGDLGAALYVLAVIASEALDAAEERGLNRQEFFDEIDARV